MRATSSSYFSFIERHTCNHAVMWRIHNSLSNHNSGHLTRWMNNQAACSFLFQSFSHAHGKLPFVLPRVQPPQPPRVYQLWPSIPQGRVYQQLHLRDLVKGAPSVKPWETGSALWYASNTVQLCFIDVGHHFFWKGGGGLVFKLISVLEAILFCKLFWRYFRMWIYQNTFLYKLLNSFTPKILHLYLVTDSMSQPTFVIREMTRIDTCRRKTSLIYIHT